MKTHIELNNGEKMPIVGFGTWLPSNPNQIEGALEVALELGYRHFDTAYSYLNEEIIGRVLKKWIDSGRVTRKELFITTKLPPTGMKEELVEHFLRLSLQNLQLDYVDLYLIHSPMGFNYQSDSEHFPQKNGKLDIDLHTNLEAIWKAMEVQAIQQRTKSIGLSNFNSMQIRRIVNIAQTQPAILQIELHAYLQQKPLREYCRSLNIPICAYAPLGSPGLNEFLGSMASNIRYPSIMENPHIVLLAKKYSKTPAQIILRFLIQTDVAVIPRSTKARRIYENIEIFDFEIAETDIIILQALDRGQNGRRFDFTKFPGFPKHPENPYNIAF